MKRVKSKGGDNGGCRGAKHRTGAEGGGIQTPSPPRRAQEPKALVILEWVGIWLSKKRLIGQFDIVPKQHLSTVKVKKISTTIRIIHKLLRNPLNLSTSHNLPLHETFELKDNVETF